MQDENIKGHVVEIGGLESLLLYHEVYGHDEWTGTCVFGCDFKLPAQVSPLPGFITSAVDPIKHSPSLPFSSR